MLYMGKPDHGGFSLMELQDRVRGLLEEADTVTARQFWREFAYRVMVGILCAGIAISAMAVAYESGEECAVYSVSP